MRFRTRLTQTYFIKTTIIIL